MDNISADAINRESVSRRIHREITAIGYALSDESLDNVDRLASHMVSSYGNNEIVMNVRCTTATADTLRFGSVQELAAYSQRNVLNLRRLQTTHVVEEQAGVTIAFERNGSVKLDAFGAAPDMEFNAQRILDEITSASEEYPWWVRRILLRTWPLRLTRLIVIFGSAFLLILMAVYAYALQYGVTIDQTLSSEVPQGLQYKAAVAEALQSADINRKLDILLYGHLQNFQSVDLWLVDARNYIAWTLAITLTGAVSVFLGQKLKALYPAGIIVLGRSKEGLIKLHRKRDFWEAAVVVAFIVNLLAGVVVAFLL